MGDRYRRERDENVEYFGAGESYRPGGHSGQGPYRPSTRQPGDSWSSERHEREWEKERLYDREREKERERPPRQGRRDDVVDSYVPTAANGARPAWPRSSSPNRSHDHSRENNRERDRDLFDDRLARRPEPPRRERNLSPRRRSRSPYNYNRRAYSPGAQAQPPQSLPPPPSREFRRGPGAYRSRSRSPQALLPLPSSAGGPLRRNAHNEDSWRRRSPSPRNSNGPSRRSSPRGRLDRLNSVPHSPSYSSRHDNEADPAHDLYDQRDFRGHDYRDRDRDYRDHHNHNAGSTASAAPPSGPSRNGTYERPPPSAPTGPAHSAHGGPPPPRSRGGGAYAVPPAARGRSSLVYRAPSYSADTAPPAGPRAGAYGRSPPDYTGPATASPAFPFRGSNNSTSRTYPMTQRFNTSSATTPGSTSSGPPTGPSAASKPSSSHSVPVPTGPSSSTAAAAPANMSSAPSSASAASSSHVSSSIAYHLNGLPKVLPNGQLLPSGFTPEQEQKLKHLEAEAQRMRAELRERQSRVRDSLAEWDVRQRESAREALRSDLAEANLRSIEADGDDAMDVAAF